MKRIIVFGSGTAHGFWDLQGGWAQRLRKDLDQKTLDTQGSSHYELYNLGIRGEDSGTVLDRFQEEMENRYNEEAEHTVVFQFGANDAMFVYEEDDLLRNEEDFRSNLEELVEQAREYAENIIFIGLIPVEDQDIDPIPNIEGRSYTTNRMKEYNKITKQVAKENDVGFINVFNEFDSAGERLFEDGLHPNGEGHKLIYDKLKNYMNKEDII